MRQQLETPQSRALKQAILTCVALVVPNIVLWTGLFVVDGIIIQRDFNFPIFNENFEAAYFPLWNDVTSQTNIERFPRLVMMAPFIGLSMLGVEVSVILKVMIVGTFSVLTTGTYLFIKHLVKTMNPHVIEKAKFQIIALVGSFLFAYNPVNLQFVGGISILLSVGMLPVMLYIILTKMNSKFFPLIIPLPLVFSLGHPFVFVMNIVFALGFGFVFHYKVVKTKHIVKQFLFGSGLAVLLLSWLWIPYLFLQSSAVDLGREENLERETFERVSTNEFFKILLLERDQFIYTATDPQTQIHHVVHYVSLACIVGIAVSALLLYKNGISKRIALSFLSAFLLATVLALGHNGYLARPYWDFVSQSDYGWIFRSPLKFQLYQSFFATVMVALSLAFVSRKILSKKNIAIRMEKYVPCLMALAIVGSSGYGIYNSNVSSFNPIPLPEEYFEINAILKNNQGTGKVVYYPRYNEIATSWSKGHLIPPFDMKSSQVATYETSTSYAHVRNAIYDHPFTSRELQSPNYYAYLASIGVEYIVFHNDRGYDLDQSNLEYLQQSDSVTNLYSKNDWYLFGIKSNPAQTLHAVSTISLVDNLPEVLRLSTPGTPAIDRSFPNLPDFDNDYIKALHPSDINAEIPLPNKLANGKFDSWQGSLPGSWSEPTRQFKLSANLTSESGIQISTPLISRDRWSGMISEEIEVEVGKKYLFTGVAMTHNSYSSHLKIQGYSEPAMAWKDLVFISSGNETATGLSMNANTEWKRYWNTLTMPDGISKVRYVINAGGVSEITKGHAYTYMREAGVFDLEDFAVTKTEVSYNKVSATSYDIAITSEMPFILVFSEAFDKGWIASDGLGEIKPFPVYGILNGFYVEKSGDFTITLDYRPQKLFALGATISIAALIGILVYTLKLCYEYFFKNLNAGTFTGRLIIQSSTTTGDTTLLEERISDRPLGGDARNTLLRHIVFNSPIIAGIVLLILIPLFISFEDTETANLVAFLALDLLIVGCIWTAIRQATTKKETHKRSRRLN